MTAILETERVMRTDGGRLVLIGLVGGGLVLGSGLGAGCKARSVVKSSAEMTGHKGAGNDAYVAGDYERAVAEFGAYVERRPQSAWGRYRLGQSYMKLGESRMAREQFAAAYDLEPDNLEYARALADSMVAIGEVEDLFTFLDRVAANHEDSGGYLLIAEYSERLGFMDEALTAYRKAAAVDGDRSADPHRELAGFYRRIGDAENEKRAWRRVLWFTPDDAEATQRLEEMGEIVGPSFALEPGADG